MARRQHVICRFIQEITSIKEQKKRDEDDNRIKLKELNRPNSKLLKNGIFSEHVKAKKENSKIN